MPGMSTTADRLIFAALCCGAIGPATPAVAQQVVSGTIQEGAAGPAIEGAMIVLLREDGVVSRVLSAADGSFLMAAPRPGRYTLRVDRIGYSSTHTAEFDVGRDETVVRRIETSVRPVALRGLDVTGERRCQVRPGGNATAAIWEEARKALQAAKWTSDRELYRFAWTRFVRQMDAEAERITDEQRTHRRYFTPQPFRSIDPETLATEGFMREREGQLYYEAPDAGVLLSESFLDGHCFEIEQGGGNERLGLRFSPVAGGRMADVEGVLWLDRESGLLESLEYRYVNLRRSVAVRGDDASGRMSFRALPNGTWIVDEWSIRMPRLVEVRDDAGRARRYDVRAYVEEGGSISQVESTAGVVMALGESAVHGIVSDSLGRPVAGAAVQVAGTAMETRTDARGAFSLDDVGAGTWLVRASHAPLTDFGHPGAETEVTLGREETRTVALELRSLGSLVREYCSDAPDAEDAATGILVGRVLRPDGTPVSGASVRTAWSRVWGASGRRFEGFGEEADSLGIVTFCGVPDDREVVVTASFGDDESRPVSLDHRRRPEVASIDVILGVASTEDSLDPTTTRDSDLGADGPWLDSLGVPLRSDRALLHLTRRQVLDLQADSVSEIFARVPRLEVRIVEGAHTKFRLHPDANWAESLVDESCEADLFLNGSMVRYRMDEAFGLSLPSRLKPRDLTAIEIFDAATAPVPRPEGCGAIMLWVDLVRHRDDPDFTGGVHGRVNGLEGTAGQRVTVRLAPGGHEVTADERGYFDFGRLAPALYLIEADVPGWGRWSAPVEVRMGSTVEIAVGPSDAGEPGLDPATRTRSRSSRPKLR